MSLGLTAVSAARVRSLLAEHGDARHEPSGEPRQAAEALREASDLDELLPLAVAAHAKERR